MRHLFAVILIALSVACPSGASADDPIKLLDDLESEVSSDLNVISGVRTEVEARVDDPNFASYCENYRVHFQTLFDRVVELQSAYKDQIDIISEAKEAYANFDNAGALAWRCCTSHGFEDSLGESSGLDGLDEQAASPGLPYHELAHVQPLA